ncbi:hypothetical protein QBC32DRAFT_355461 [Pseudoneurospora amorphoporcata]|uniref:Uncharacterized protein n=1 Tax=Pseudoneurospora amorphoporcata TaxID=241081 RepID=A0AAN6NNW0_9PEZI|nr:hypothetical protein QBC32DRAFT_355461 [Pseudoneurospora amorphoporcata]
MTIASLQLLAKKNLKRAYDFLVCFLFRLLFLHLLAQTHTLFFTLSYHRKGRCLLFSPVYLIFLVHKFWASMHSSSSGGAPSSLPRYV